MTKSLGHEKEHGSVLARTETVKERNEVVREYLPKVLASYLTSRSDIKQTVYSE